MANIEGLLKNLEEYKILGGVVPQASGEPQDAGAGTGRKAGADVGGGEHPGLKGVADQGASVPAPTEPAEAGAGTGRKTPEQVGTPVTPQPAAPGMPAPKASTEPGEVNAGGGKQAAASGTGDPSKGTADGKGPYDAEKPGPQTGTQPQDAGAGTGRKVPEVVENVIDGLEALESLLDVA